jgi:hypothetical protein
VHLTGLQTNYYLNLMQPYCDRRDTDVIGFLAGKSKSPEFDPAAICLKRLGSRYEPVYRKFLLDNINIARQVGDFLELLAAKEITSEDYRLLVTASVSDLTVSLADSRPARPVTELTAVSMAGWSNLPATTRQLVELLTQLVQAGEFQKVADLTIRDPRFYDAFSVLQANHAFESLPVLFPEERVLARVKLSKVFQRFLSGLLNRLGKQASAALTREIDWDRLGYQPDKSQ